MGGACLSKTGSRWFLGWAPSGMGGGIHSPGTMLSGFEGSGERGLLPPIHLVDWCHLQHQGPGIPAKECCAFLKRTSPFALLPPGWARSVSSCILMRLSPHAGSG